MKSGLNPAQRYKYKVPLRVNSMRFRMRSLHLVIRSNETLSRSPRQAVAARLKSSTRANLPEPSPLLRLRHTLLVLSIDDIQGFLTLGRSCEILVSIFGDKNIILNAHTSDGVVFVE